MDEAPEAQQEPDTPTRRPVVAMVAHDNRKDELKSWALFNRELLAHCELIATGTTGALLAESLELPVERLMSGPLGGDQQLGARIAEGDIDLVVFFWDPLTAQPHDTDVKALLRLSTLWNCPTACNRATADYLVSSPLFGAVESGWTYTAARPQFQARNPQEVLAEAQHEA
ncbi:MAG: methylglyoxal synthase [Actinomycetes bacterium]